MLRWPHVGPCCFFFNDTATTEIYTLSLHDALPISRPALPGLPHVVWELARLRDRPRRPPSNPRRRDRGHESANVALAGRSRRRDRKSTRLNSSHQIISYAVFCLKKKKQPIHNEQQH